MERRQKKNNGLVTEFFSKSKTGKKSFGKVRKSFISCFKKTKGLGLELLKYITYCTLWVTHTIKTLHIFFYIYGFASFVFIKMVAYRVILHCSFFTVNIVSAVCMMSSK